MKRIALSFLLLFALFASAVRAQAPASVSQSVVSSSPSAAAAEVPRLIKFSGTLLDDQSRPLAGPVGVTFALYAQQNGGAALWMETQNAKPDENGNYTVLLGANSANGVPAELFTSTEARWLGIQVGQQPEHERTLLVSVPYALKAGDAETLGGKPLSSFVLNETQATSGSGTSAASQTTTEAVTTPKTGSGAKPAISGTGSTNVVPKWTDTAGTLGNSRIFDNGTNVGIGTTSPAVALDVMGNNAGLRLSGTGTHQVTVTGATSGRLGQDSNGFFFSSDTNGKSVRFLTNNGTLNEWMRITSTGNVGIGTTTPGTKLEIAGGNLALPNTTSASVGVITLGGNSFVHNFGTYNTFLGALAGNLSMTGGSNTATGYQALYSNTTGASNTASGYQALWANTTGAGNTATGFDALSANTTGNNNTANGYLALYANTTGPDNTANGYAALAANTTGAANTASGYQALAANTTGNDNTASGMFALYSDTTGNYNTAIGAYALYSDTTGSGNVALGANALYSNSTGTGNVAIGGSAGVNATTGNANIYIANAGVAAEQNTIRIGVQGTQTATFIAGISGGTTAAGAVPVLVDIYGQLGTTSSSRRFKYDINDMDQASNGLLRLRPVTFRYKQAQNDGSHPLQYGLIAEEVATVYPDLVQFDKTGEPQTVLYHLLPAMLLNEMQKQHGQIEALKQENTELRQQLQAVLLQVKQIRDLVEAASAKPGNTIETSPAQAGAFATAEGQQTSSTN